MSDLLPPAPSPPPRHHVETTQQVGPCGGPTRTYRGARIESNEKGTLFPFLMPGHPHHGTTRGNWENAIPLIDRWLGHGNLPAPYSLRSNKP